MHKCSYSHGLGYALTKLLNWWSFSKFWWNNPWSRWSLLWNNPYHGLSGFHYVSSHFFGGLLLNSSEMVIKPSNSSGRFWLCINHYCWWFSFRFQWNYPYLTPSINNGHGIGGIHYAYSIQMVIFFKILVKQFLNHKIQMVMMVFVILIMHQALLLVILLYLVK
jgi:hypothetical protein